MIRPTAKLPRRNRRGFTLIEVLVTMVMMGIILPVALHAMSSAMLAASYARHATEAATLGQSKLNEMVAMLMSGEVNTISGSGDFGPGWPDYTWECQETYDTNLAVTQLDLKVVWLARGQERSVLLSTMVADPTAVATEETTTN